MLLLSSDLFGLVFEASRRGQKGLQSPRDKMAWNRTVGVRGRGDRAMQPQIRVSTRTG